MGNQPSAETDDAEGGSERKKKSFLNCQCGRGRDDKDEVNGDRHQGKVTRLTEEEWAKVKTGRLHVDRGQPDLVLEESEHSKVPPRSRLYAEGDAVRADRANGGSRETAAGAGAKQEPKNPYKDLLSKDKEKPRATAPLRFKVGDRVKCACKKWCLLTYFSTRDPLAMHAYALLADGIDMHAFRFLLGDVYAGSTVIHDRLVVVACSAASSDSEFRSPMLFRTSSCTVIAIT
jgi:hypothetical protein